MLIAGIFVEADPAIPGETVLREVANERLIWSGKGKALATIRIYPDNGEVVVEAFEKSPIRRVRRITGYLSHIDNLNDAKKSEVEHRVAHSL